MEGSSVLRVRDLGLMGLKNARLGSPQGSSYVNTRLLTQSQRVRVPT